MVGSASCVSLGAVSVLPSSLLPLFSLFVSLFLLFWRRSRCVCVCMSYNILLCGWCTCLHRSVAELSRALGQHEVASLHKVLRLLLYEAHAHAANA